jgi:hypothetical protein
MSDRSATTSTISNSIGPGGAAYELRKDTEIYAEYSGKFVNEKVTTESYDGRNYGQILMTCLPSAAIGNR